MGHGAQSGGAITRDRECSHPRSSAALRLCFPPGGPVCVCVLCVCYGSTGTADANRARVRCGDAQTTQQCHALS
eukprot:5058252-Prymnesium_polylepis.1